MTRRTAKPTATARADRWVNFMTALGNAARDKTQSASFMLENVSETEAENLWRGDDMGAKIVTGPVEEMFRQGYELKIGGELRDREAIERAALKHATALGVDTVLQVAQEYMRAYGGGGVLIGADDGTTDLRKPLNLDAIREVRFLTVFRPRELIPATWYRDPTKSKFGQPQSFYVVPETETNYTRAELKAQFSAVHESRFVIFRGVIVSRTQLRQNNGWGDSVFVRVLHVLSQFHQVWGASAHLISDFSQAVLKIPGLDALLSGTKRGLIMERAAAIDMTRSMIRSIILGEGEEWTRQATPMAGLSDVVNLWMFRLASTADMPASRLFGQAPAGLNATGDSDIRWWYDRIASKQDKELRPGHQYLYRVIFRDRAGPTGGREPETWEIKYRSLWQLSEKEQAERNKLQAEADEKYHMMGLSTDEILQSRFGGDGYSMETKLDLESRNKMARALAERESAAPDEKGGTGKGELLTPTDVASIVTVNQALAWLEFPPKTLPGGALDPEGELTVSQYQAKHAPIIAAANAATSGETAPPPARPQLGPASTIPQVAAADRRDAMVVFFEQERARHARKT